MTEETTRRRFQQEAELLGRLDHPNIARILEARTDSTTETAFLVMELVEGRPLTEHARETGLSRDQLLRLWSTLCRAVQYAHSQGVVHRDLKPANVLVAGSGETSTLKVLDFGIARVVSDDDETTRHTLAGELIGTLAYMSPEQAAGDPNEIDTRSDVYCPGSDRVRAPHRIPAP